MFYTYDRVLLYRVTESLQGALNMLMGIFWRIGLEANITKYNNMICHPGDIRLGISKEAFVR